MSSKPINPGTKRCFGKRCLRRCSDGVVKTLESFAPGSDLCLVCSNDLPAPLPPPTPTKGVTETRVRQIMKEEVGQNLTALLRTPEAQEILHAAARKAILFVLQSAAKKRKTK